MKTKKILFIVMMIGAFASAASYGQEASKENAPEPEKVKVEVSDTIVTKHAGAVTSDLKAVIREAENNLKRIDGTLTGKNNEKTAKELVKKGNDLYKEGKYEEARDSYRQANKLTSDADLKRTIKDNEGLVEGKANEQQRERLAVEKAKADTEMKAAEAKSQGEKLEKSKAAQKAHKPMTVQPAMRKQQPAMRRSVPAPARQTGPAVNFTPANVSQAEPVHAYRTAVRSPVVDDSAARQAAMSARAKLAAEEKAAQEAAAAKARAEAEEKAKAVAEAAEVQAKVYEEPKMAAPAVTVPSAVEAPVETPAAPAPPVMAATPAATGDDAVSKMYRDAVSLYWDNKYEEAKAKFEKIKDMSPEYARTGYYLGRIKEKMTK